jgi:hypothetical protein
MAIKLDNKSVRKAYPDGKTIKAWKNTAGISVGFKENAESNLHDPFMSFYSRRDGGYVVVIRKNLLDMHNIKLEVVDE